MGGRHERKGKGGGGGERGQFQSCCCRSCVGVKGKNCVCSLCCSLGKSWVAREVCITYRLKENTMLLKFLATLCAKT